MIFIEAQVNTSVRRRLNILQASTNSADRKRLLEEYPPKPEVSVNMTLLSCLMLQDLEAATKTSMKAVRWVQDQAAQ